MDEPSTPPNWIREKYPGTFDEFCEEQRASVIRERPEWAGTEYDRPGGYAWKLFDRFAKSFEEGDELWFFVTPSGWEGYAIVRGGKVVDHFITLYAS